MKRIRFFSVAIVLCTGSLACAGRSLPPANPVPLTPEWERTLVLSEGQLVPLEDAGFKLGFIGPVEDSRCPDEPGVVCEQKGQFVGKFSFESVINRGGQNEAFVFLMSTGEHCALECGPMVFAGNEQSEGGSVYYTVAIEDVLPHRSESREILEPYRVRLRIAN